MCVRPKGRALISANVFIFAFSISVGKSCWMSFTFLERKTKEVSSNENALHHHHRHPMTDRISFIPLDRQCDKRSLFSAKRTMSYWRQRECEREKERRNDIFGWMNEWNEMIEWRKLKMKRRNIIKLIMLHKWWFVYLHCVLWFFIFIFFYLFRWRRKLLNVFALQSQSEAKMLKEIYVWICK